MQPKSQPKLKDTTKPVKMDTIKQHRYHRNNENEKTQRGDGKHISYLKIDETVSIIS